MDSKRLVACMLGLLVAVAAHAAPETGQKVPDITVQDVTGEPQRLRALIEGGERTLLVAIMDRDAEPKMRAWFEAADEKAPATIQRISVLALDLPFFVSDDYARSTARDKVPKRYWHETLMGTDGKLARLLGLGAGETPWVFVIDGEGKVLARLHGNVKDPKAREIWDALAADAR